MFNLNTEGGVARTAVAPAAAEEFTNVNVEEKRG